MAHPRLARLVAVVLALAGLAAACGDDDDDGAGDAAATTGATASAATSAATSAGGATGTTSADSAGTTVAAAATGEPIRIGSVITQDAPISFTASADMLRAWVDWVNDTGGINGRPVELELLDDQLDPTKAREAFGKLIDDDSIVAIVGSFAPLGIGAALPDIEAAGLPLVPGDGLVAAEFDIDAAYMLVSRPEDYGAQACAEAVRRGWLRAALLYLDTDSIRPIIDGYADCAEERGGEVVLSEAVPFGAPSMADVALRVIEADPDVIFLEIDANATAQLWGELDLQEARIPSLGNPGIYEDVLRDYPGPAAEGFVIQTAVLPPHSDEPVVEAIRQTVEQYRPGTKLIPVGMSAWAGAELFRTAAETAGDDLTRETLQTALDGITDFTADGLTPPISYTAENHAGSSSYWFFELTDGAWGPVGPLREGVGT
jgi:branched-chain amino acid transport system substrate-binding protein